MVRRQKNPRPSVYRPGHRPDPVSQRDKPPTRRRLVGADYRSTRRVGKRLLCTLITVLTLAPGHAAAKPPVRDCPQYHAAMRKAGLPPRIFGPIAYRESRCHPGSISAVRSTGWPDAGLLQIQGSWNTLTAHVCHVPRGRAVIHALATLTCNLRVAAVLWDDGRGAHNWGIRKHN